MNKLLIALLITLTPTLAHANRAELATCQYGIMIAQKAYLTGTFDAQRPDIAELEYLVDYWADELVVQADRKVAMRTVRYVAKMLKLSGIRRPSEDMLYQPIQHALNNECGRYVEVEQ